MDGYYPIIAMKLEYIKIRQLSLQIKDDKTFKATFVNLGKCQENKDTFSCIK